MKKVIGQQGETRIVKIGALPDGMETKNVEQVAKGFVVSHSESGHHHILTGGEVMERTDNIPDGLQKIYAILDQPAQLIQDAPGAHKPFNLDPGIYCFVNSREYDPFADQARRVAD